MILSASAFNSCMIEFSIPDYNEKIIKNIFKHWTSWVVFRTQWFIGQYCSEREGRGYRCRCTSVPFSLYFISILWVHSKDDRKGDEFFRFQTITGAQVRFLQRFSSLSFLLSVYGLGFFFSYSCNAFPHFFSTFSIRPSIPSLLHCPTGHECRRFRCQNRIKNYILRRKCLEIFYLLSWKILRIKAVLANFG